MDFLLQKISAALVLTVLLCPLSAAGNESVIKPKIIRVLSHPGRGFTQGLFYYQNLLFEGTGLENQSRINIIKTSDGSLTKSVPLEKYFGEGIASLGNKLVQLTWKSGQALVYSFPDLEPLEQFSYKGQGWGLTSDSGQYIMSNGSSIIYFRDSNFKIIRKIMVTAVGKEVDKLNELEYAAGYIYANVWYKDFILKIDPKTGKVISRIDCGELVKIENPVSQENVLNGIAYNSETGMFYITGKRWNNIFEVLIPEQ